MYTELHPQDNSISLFFNSLQEDQAGQYICRGTYANTELLSKTVIIETIGELLKSAAKVNKALFENIREKLYVKVLFGRSKD